MIEDLYCNFVCIICIIWYSLYRLRFCLIFMLIIEIFKKLFFSWFKVNNIDKYKFRWMYILVFGIYVRDDVI